MNTAAQTADFAGTKGARDLELMRIGTALQNKKNALANQRAGLDIQRQNVANQQFARSSDLALKNRRFGLQKDEYKDAKRQGKIAMLLGGASLIPRAYMGYQGYKKSGQTSEDVIKLAKDIDSAWARVPNR
jgi:hypothetical protein